MLRQLIDIALVLSLTYAVLLLIGERRTLWMVRGFVVLMLITAISRHLGLVLLGFFLTYLTLGASVAMAVLLQAEFRRFLERLGRGEIWRLLNPVGVSAPKSDDTIDELVDAVKELSQNRTGALIVLETDGTFDERDFSVPGVQLQAQVSKELLQTIFQTSTLLHDGAVLIQGANISSAGAILPLSDRQASRQLGTRHRAAMGITERVENCLCVVVSEETGSISLAERGALNRPLTSSRLRELLQERFSVVSDRESGVAGWNSLPLDGLSFPLRRSRLRRWFSWLRPRRKQRSRQFTRAIQGSISPERRGDRPVGNRGMDSTLNCPLSASPSGPVVEVRPLTDFDDKDAPEGAEQNSDANSADGFSDDFARNGDDDPNGWGREPEGSDASSADGFSDDFARNGDDDPSGWGREPEGSASNLKIDPESKSLDLLGGEGESIPFGEGGDSLRPNHKPDSDKYNWGSRSQPPEL